MPFNKVSLYDTMCTVQESARFSSLLSVERSLERVAYVMWEIPLGKMYMLELRVMRERFG